MRLVSAVLDRLLSAAGVSETGRLSLPLDPAAELRALDSGIEKLRLAGRGQGGRPPTLDLEALLRRWRSKKPELEGFSVRELRALCWDARTAGDRQFVESLVDRGFLPVRIPMLRGLWHAHQQAWRLPTAGLIEELIKKASKGQERRPRWLEAVATDDQLLTAQAPQGIAAVISANWRAQEVLTRLSVTPPGQLGRLAMEESIKSWLREIRTSLRDASTDEVIESGAAGILDPNVMPPETFQSAIEALLAIVAKGDGRSIRPTVARLILSDSRLGHPKRVATRGNWVGFSEKAINTAVQLFAARDLKAFFEILIGRNADQQERRRFWERYVESPQLVDFAIACDPHDMRLLRAKSGNERASVARLDLAPDNHSAFIMRFSGRKDIIIAEMSKANNAMYVFDAEIFEEHVGELERGTFRFRQLKNQTIMLDRRSHVPGWHGKFDEDLQRWGIHPGKRW